MSSVRWNLARVFSLGFLLTAMSIALAGPNDLIATFKITNADRVLTQCTSTKAPPPQNSSIWTITDVADTHACDGNGASLDATFTWNASGTGRFEMLKIKKAKQTWNYAGGAPASSVDGSFVTTAPVASAHTAQRWIQPGNLPGAAAAGAPALAAGASAEDGPGIGILVYMEWANWDPVVGDLYYIMLEVDNYTEFDIDYGTPIHSGSLAAGHSDLMATNVDSGPVTLDSIGQIVDTWFVTYMPGTLYEWTDAYTGAFWTAP